MKKTDPKPFKIPEEGSLGILALGAVGIRAWKEKRKRVGYINPNTNFMKKKPEELREEVKKKVEAAQKEDKKK